MKYISIYAFLFIRHITSTAVINDEEHSFLRRLQAIQLPQCGKPLCWCDVNAATSTSSVCPEYPGDSIYTGKEDIATFFASLELKNPTNQDLQLCYPDLSTSVNLQGDSIDPNILCEEGILLGGKSTKDSNVPRHCLKGCKKHPDTAVCGIKFMHDEALCQITPDNYDTNCSSDKVADSYMVKTFRNDKKRQKRGYFSFHEGACGVCSTAQDVASFMRYSFPDTNNQVTIDILSFLCYKTITLNPTPLYPKALVDQISLCLQNGITGIVPSADLSPTCAYAWAINVFLDGLPEAEGGCYSVCSGMLDLIINGTCTPAIGCPYSPKDCSLQDCLQCDASVSGSQFIELSGITRRNTGIHTLLPHPCGSLTNISHTCIAQV